MKASIILTICIFLCFVSCDNSRTKDRNEEETPMALEDKSSSGAIVSKRGNADLVEGLYDELVDNTPELKELEDGIDKLRKTQRDSTELFDIYNSKNESYYNSANQYGERITDSLLRTKMSELIANSLTEYNSLTSSHKGVLSSIQTKNLLLSDLHTVLKITRTLPVIEKYQRNALPATKPLEGFLKHLEETVLYADTLTKK